MAKRKKRNSSPFNFLLARLAKKSSIGGLIVLLAWTLYQLIGTIHLPQSIRLPASDEPVALYANQTHDDLNHLYQKAIGSAQKSITLIIYALTDDQIIHALSQKSESGIPLHIVCDAKASRGIGRKLPRAFIIKRLLDKGFVHQKILIIDEKQIILGSANLTPGSLNSHGNLVAAIENPSLAQALNARAKSMDEEGGAMPFPYRETTAGNQKLEICLLPDDTTAAKRIIDHLRAARKTIKVAMFTWTRVDFTQELIAAAKRGVKVETVIDRYQGKGTSAKIVKMLDEAGIPVRLSTGQGLLHHKFAYIDDNFLINGSANWTNQAFKDNDDYYIVVSPLTTEQRDKMNQLWEAIQQQSAKPVKNR